MHLVDEMKLVKGGCMCGSIRYEASGAPQGAGYCHCRSCRHHTGAPVAAFVVFTVDQVHWTSGVRARFESSPGTFRSFCRDCGTSLTWERHDRKSDLVEFHISTLDNPNEFPPNEHTHYLEKISWLHLPDELPRYEAGMY